eukprot:scaffold18198_cov43-Prasinocladus_malaysianus.AAC.3
MERRKYEHQVYICDSLQSINSTLKTRLRATIVRSCASVRAILGGTTHSRCDQSCWYPVVCWRRNLHCDDLLFSRWSTTTLICHARFLAIYHPVNLDKIDLRID